MASMSPTQRTLRLLRSEMGMDACIVEKWNGHSKTRVDAFGFGDILACGSGYPPVLVQCTSTSNLPARVKKIMDEDKALSWLDSGGAIWAIGWKKYKRVGNQKQWRHTMQIITRDAIMAFRRTKGEDTNA